MIDRETAMKLASDAGFGYMLSAEPGLPKTWVGADADKLQRFAAAVAQKAAEAEREACARLAEATQRGEPRGDYQNGCDDACRAIAKSIRARGTGGSG